MNGRITWHMVTETITLEIPRKDFNTQVNVHDVVDNFNKYVRDIRKLIKKETGKTEVDLLKVEVNPNDNRMMLITFERKIKEEMI